MNREILSIFHQRSQHCSNCGKYGHINRFCKDPVTSLGVVCILFSSDAVRDKFLDMLWRESTINVPRYNMYHNHVIPCVADYHDDIRFLMIRRKHSLGFLEFMRGRYEIRDYQSITKLFKLMTQEEIDIVSKSDFQTIWDSIWSKTAFLKIYEEEYKHSYEKFTTLKSKYKEENILGLSYYTNNVSPDWVTPEWGFPKGRRANFEKNYDCALREFKEETGYDPEDHEVVDCVQPLKEVFKGTNNVTYKHLYYLSYLKSTDKKPYIDTDNKEVGDIRWLTYSEAMSLIRPYHVEKKKVLNDVFHFIVSTLKKNDPVPSYIS